MAHVINEPQIPTEHYTIGKMPKYPKMFIKCEKHNKYGIQLNQDLVQCIDCN
ncbi:hypothetical protein LCGC14_0175640 [marine sediment metagenome]|uniref:Uncharacterized protein n=1 Tax=marine sediment metagenome TaxID=412755 RepID=A0A0F9URD0_9ZZZZ